MSPFCQGCSGRLKGAFGVLLVGNLVVWQRDLAFCGGDGGGVTIVLLSSIGGMRQLIQSQCFPMHNQESFSARVEIYFQAKDTAVLEEIAEKIRSHLVSLFRYVLVSMCHWFEYDVSCFG